MLCRSADAEEALAKVECEPDVRLTLVDSIALLSNV
jgi:hypothetical protein